jgi:hypothetical protein
VPLQALTNLGRLSSRRWQSFPTVDGRNVLFLTILLSLIATEQHVVICSRNIHLKMEPEMFADAPQHI